MAGSNETLILVTNDDGIFAPGIDILARALQPLGEVFVVAPDRNCSGVSHSISLHRILRSHHLGDRRIAVEGVPADCVYLGIHELLPRKPDLVVSGINAGPNLSFDVHYSGTVGAAVEGTLLGVPSVAVSLVDPAAGSFEIAARFTKATCARVLREGLASNVTLNINVPGGRPTHYQTTFLGHRLFRHSVHKRSDPRGEPYYWIGGVPDEPMDVPGSDCNAVASGVVSISPLGVDMTHRLALAEGLRSFELDGFEREPSIAPPDDLDLVPAS